MFVEYGPGVGTFTEHVLRRMAPDATLIAIDTNADFIRYLRGKFTDSRLFPVTGSAADVRQIIADCGFEHADYILSGLPFSTLPPGVGPKIAEETAEALRPGGAFLVYQFKAKVRDFMAPHFDADRQGLRMGQHPALPPLLGLEGLTSRHPAAVSSRLRRPRRGLPPPESSPEIEPPRQIVVGGRDQEIAERPFEPVPPGHAGAVRLGRDPLAVGDLAVDEAAHHRREAGIVDPEHHLEIEIEAPQVEIRRADMDDVVDDDRACACSLVG